MHRQATNTSSLRAELEEHQTIKWTFLKKDRMFDFRDSLKSKARRLQRISQILEHNEHQKNNVLERTSDTNFEKGVTHYYSRLSLPGANLESSVTPEYDVQHS